MSRNKDPKYLAEKLRRTKIRKDKRKSERAYKNKLKKRLINSDCYCPYCGRGNDFYN